MADFSGSYAYLNTLQTLVREGFVTKAIVDTFFTSQRFFPGNPRFDGHAERRSCADLAVEHRQVVKHRRLRGELTGVCLG